MDKLFAGDLPATLRMIQNYQPRVNPDSETSTAPQWQQPSDSSPVCNECGGARIIAEERTDTAPGGATYMHMVGRVCPSCIEREKRGRMAARAAEISAECGLGRDQLTKTFEAFESFEENRDAYLAALRFAGAPAREWLVIGGDVGNGKTHLLSAIANTAASAGIPTLYGYVPQLLDYLRAGFGQGGEDAYHARFQRLLDVDLLLLDDLGAEKDSEFAVERLLTVFDARLRDRRGLAVTTNLTEAKLKKLSLRLWSRIERYPATVVWNAAGEYHKRGK